MNSIVLRIVIFIITLSSCIASWLFFFKYDKETNYTTVYGTVLQKYNGNSRNGPVFILIVKTSNKACDFKVTPSTYATTNIGDRVVFSNVHKSQVYKDYNKNPTIVWLFLNILFSICTLLICSGCIIGE
jgi:hypothetical protein